MTKNKRLTAFTLAEVLITLAIIGVVAALTLPTLIQDARDKATVSKVKKMWTTLANAVKMAEVHNGDVADWGEYKMDQATGKMIAEKLKPYLKVDEMCGSEGCKHYNVTTPLFLNGDKDVNDVDFSKDNYYKMILTDGSVVIIRVYDTTCDKNNASCFTLSIDINGDNGPNIQGRDIFQLGAIQYKAATLKILGGYGENPVTTPDWASCDPKRGQGWYCTAWVIYKENLDYLKCAEKLSWSGKSTCK